MEMDIETYKKKKNVSPIKNLQEFNWYSKHGRIILNVCLEHP
jgi:hypothetical protein